MGISGEDPLVTVRKMQRLLGLQQRDFDRRRVEHDHQPRDPIPAGISQRRE